MLKSENIIDDPKLMSEWDYEKNGDLRPEDCVNEHDRFVWWRCTYGHSWQARIRDRMKGSGCPYDCGKRTLGFKSFASVRPDLVSEWDYKGNDHLSPDEISAYSQIKVKWRCKNGHSYIASASNQSRGNGCFICLKERLENGR
jgi:translation initiation factor IF-1